MNEMALPKPLRNIVKKKVKSAEKMIGMYSPPHASKQDMKKELKRVATGARQHQMEKHKKQKASIKRNKSENPGMY